MEVKKKYLYLIRSIYLCMLTAYTILREVIPLRFIIGSGVLSYAFFFIGLILVATNIWLDRDHTTKANVGLFIAFIAVCIISTLINFKYDFISNVRAIGWTCLFFFLLYPTGFHSKVNNNREVNGICITAIITFSILVFISLPMYFFDVDYTYLNENIIGTESSQGFSNAFVRLWGVFGDPNTAAVYAFVALIMGVYLFRKYKKLWVRILLVISWVLTVLFVVLSGSRTAKWFILVVCGFAAFYIAVTLIKGKKLKKVTLSCISCALAVVIAYGAFVGLSHALPQVKKGVKTVCGTSITTFVHSAYDGLYKVGGVEVTSGFLSEDNGNNGGNQDGSGGGQGGNGGSLTRPDVQEKGDISNGRFEIWLAALELYTFAPIFGVSPRGAAAFGAVHLPDNNISLYEYSMHNTLLEVLTGTGAIGLILILAILLNALIIIVKRTLKKPFSLNFVSYSSGLLLLLCSSMLLSDLFFSLTFGGLAFWLALGLINGEDKYVLPEEIVAENVDGKKRILIYGPKDPVGGVEKIVLEYVKNIIATHKDVSFDFLMYGKNFSLEKELTDLGCRVIYLPSRFRHYFKYKKAIEEVFANNRYIAVWGNYSGLTNIDLLVFAKKYYIPVRIAHSHGSRLYWGSKIMKYVVFILHYYNKLWLSDYATSYWACSDLAGEFMFPKKVQEKVEMIYNAVDTEKFYPDKVKGNEIRATLNIDNDDIVKNQFFLLKVIKEAVLINPKAKLLLVGDGELREQIEQEIVNLNLSENVIYLGERKDVPELLRAMDVFVLTSFAEGLSVSAVEAQACGLPCVLPTSVSTETDIIGLVEFIPLDKPIKFWAERILASAKLKAENVKEKISDNGYDIHRAAERVYQSFCNI